MKYWLNGGVMSESGQFHFLTNLLKEVSSIFVDALVNWPPKFYIWTEDQALCITEWIKYFVFENPT